MKALAWGPAVAAVAMYAATLALIFLPPGESFLGSAVADAGLSGSFVAFAIVGSLIAARLPRLTIGWLFCAVGVPQTADLLLLHHLLDVRAGGGDLPAIPLWFYNWLWALPAVALTTLLPLLFPDGAPPSRRWRLAAQGSWVAIAMLTFTFMFGPRVTEPFGDVPNPARLVDDPSVGALLEAGSSLAWGLATLGCIAGLVARFRRSRGIERQQLKWFTYAAALAAALLMLYAGLAVVLGERAALSVVGQVLPLLITLVPIAAGVAIFRYRLYDIDLIINRSVVYSVLSPILLATYLTAVVLFQTVLRPLTGGSELAVAASTLAVVGLFQPLRRRIQNLVDRRFYRSRYDAARTLDAFGARLRDEVDLDAVRAHLLDTVERTVRPVHAALWLRPSAPRT